MDWRECDLYYQQLQDVAIFWTVLHLTGDALYCVLIFTSVFENPYEIRDQKGWDVLSPVNPLLLYLTLSIISNFGVIFLFRKEKTFLVFSIIKGSIFPLTLITQLYLLMTKGGGRRGEEDIWIYVICILTAYNILSLYTLWAHYSFHSYTNWKVELERVATAKQEDGALEKFYIQKTAQLHHSFAVRMKDEGEQIDLRHFFDDEVDEEAVGQGDEEEEEKQEEEAMEQGAVVRDVNGEQPDRVWTVSDKVNINDYDCVYNVQISL